MKALSPSYSCPVNIDCATPATVLFKRTVCLFYQNGTNGTLLPFLKDVSIIGTLMNRKETKEKIEAVKAKLLKMKEITSFIELGMFELESETGTPFLERSADMEDEQPEKNSELHAIWEEVQQIMPPAFSVDSNLLRHLSFNEAHDWYDISNTDIPKELLGLEEYEKKLTLVEYLEDLHYEVSRVSETILNGDIEMALKAVFARLDTKIRSKLSAASDEKTVPLIGKAFREGTLVPPVDVNPDGVRNFLQGVMGYYRNVILHNELPPKRNTIEGSLSLFTLAHEAFRLFEICSRNIEE